MNLFIYVVCVFIFLGITFWGANVAAVGVGFSVKLVMSEL